MEKQILEVQLSPDVREAIKEMTRSIAESRRDYETKIAESRRESDASRRKTDAMIAESRRETERVIADSRRDYEAKIAESEARLDAALRRFMDEGDKTIKRLKSDVGGVGHSLGRMTELLVVPGIKIEMEKVGHKFTRSYANKKFKGFVRGFRQLIAEVDLFLSNGDEAMAVEIKTSLSAEDVNNHLDRLKKLRDYEEDTNLKDKKLYGAIVGVLIDYHARKLALKNGLYVVEVLEYEKMLKTEKPERRKAW